MNNQSEIEIKAEKKFIIKWNKVFADTFNYKTKNDLTISRDYWLGKKDFTAPWYPILFLPKKNSLSYAHHQKIEKNNKAFSLFFLPEKNFNNQEVENLLKNNQLIHYITLENKTSSDFLNSLKSRTRSYIKSGLKKFKFIKISYYDQFLKYEKSLHRILIEQHIKFLSPMPPLKLLKNLLINNLIDIHLAFENDLLVGFSTITKDKFLPHIFWILKSDFCKSNSLSLCLYYVCIEESIIKKAKLISLGTSISKNVAHFKEKLRAERGILFKHKLNSISSYKKLFFIKTGRNYLSLTIMRVFISIILFVFGEIGFEIISYQIWKRFD